VTERRTGSELLHRPPPQDYLEDWAALLGQPVIEAPPAQMSLFLFAIEDERLALPVECLHEIVDPLRVHTVPNRKSDVLLGLVNLHGRLEICVTLLPLLKNRAPSRTACRKMMVWGTTQRRYVTPVDEVIGVERFQAHAVRPAAAGVSTSLKGIIFRNLEPIGLLDDSALHDGIQRSILR